MPQHTYLFEVVRHLYRWHLDESEIERIMGQKQFVFWLRRLDPRLDPGDRSVFAEILLPQLNICLVVKKADYTIEELAATVQSPGFKITRITRSNIPDRQLRTCQEVRVDMMQMRDYLFRTRNQQEFPDEQMIERMRSALRKQIAQEGIQVAGLPLTERVVHLAPLSPVANETWVFWEDGRKLFYFASDIDLANPAVWQHETLMSRIFDLDQQVVVSHQEAPGSNRFLTRYQVSRALFNCVVLGRRMVIQPPDIDLEASIGEP
jgi:predicted nuclease of predicted toxin-antitoxin system